MREIKIIQNIRIAFDGIHIDVFNEGDIVTLSEDKIKRLQEHGSVAKIVSKAEPEEQKVVKIKEKKISKAEEKKSAE